MSMLKPQDILVLLKLVATPEDSACSYGRLATELQMSPSEVHQAIKRARQSRLVSQETRTALNNTAVAKAEFLEFLVHGLKYCFPPILGGETRGVPTAHAAPVLSSLFADNGLPPVWPDPDGSVRGLEFSPLYRTVPAACAKDGQLYDLLALVDAIRGGRARERHLAEEELKKRLLAGGARNA